MHDREFIRLGDFPRLIDTFRDYDEKFSNAFYEEFNNIMNLILTYY